jgi:2,3-bisphosphoglycerate-independent phosphoglycerate mutase
MDAKAPVALVILDGFGYSKNHTFNAVYTAKTPYLDSWMIAHPPTLLQASGHAVGLPQGYSGNSAVGHLTIGAGRVVEQPMTTIHRAIRNKSFFQHPILVDRLVQLRRRGCALHLMGLLSDAGVHTDIEHLFALLDCAQQHGIRRVFIHPFLDGRDVPPRSAVRYLSLLDQALSTFEYGSIGSLHGRFYAMDRDHHWDRTKQSYQTLTAIQEFVPRAWSDVLEENYGKGITDEFIVPTRLDPTSVVEDGDGIIFFNIRADRARQLTATFVEKSFDAFARKQIELAFFITPIAYGSGLITDVLFPRPNLTHTLKDVLNAAGKSIFSIAETEKYAHITYFFDGGKEEVLEHETRVLIPSLPSHDYSKNPEMSAHQITDAVLASLRTAPCDFYLINYANADMVGHSGDFHATVQAVELLDQELKRLFDVLVDQMGGMMIVTSDHGKAEEMFDWSSGQHRTAHTTNPVPFIVLTAPTTTMLLSPSVRQLIDIAPFILRYMGLPIPQEMSQLYKKYG